jgi:hypothetical protein
LSKASSDNESFELPADEIEAELGSSDDELFHDDTDWEELFLEDISEDDGTASQVELLKARIMEDYLVGKQHTRGERGKYAGRMFWLVVGWLAAVVGMLVFSALGLFNMSERLLITIITATTVKVLGLLYVVMRHLFPLPK